MTDIDTLIEQIRERAQDDSRATDDGRAPGKVAAPPATEAEVSAATVQLGFLLPSFLQRLYKEVGAGGFGPGHGLFSILLETDTLADQYKARREPGKDRRPTNWPDGLLPIVDWGSGILSAVDCMKADLPVVRLDANMPKVDVLTRVPSEWHYEKAGRIPEACWLEAASLQRWLEDWIEGRQLFYRAYSLGTLDVDLEGDDEAEEEDEEE
ncbi:MAG: SMI1/KNR4 family protein [Capsulimonas sp.]|uniref:SMI1/KNR4 family protein n=1 Tax=Capsulimonas sp. TaxID=2494211 RepID=UPI0032669655